MGWFRKWKKQPPQIYAAGYPQLDTPRLTLRMFTPADVPALFAYAKSDVVGPLAGWAPHRNQEETRQVVSLFIKRGDVWAIVDKKSGRLVGSVGLHVDAKRSVEKALMLGYVLGEPDWGKGFATEASARVLRFAFEQLGCPVVSAYHYPHNKRSAHVIAKLGFTPEGTLRLASTLVGGSVTDDVCYSITAADYRAGVRETLTAYLTPRDNTETR